jgi:ribosomal protein L11 methylase PrmA
VEAAGANAAANGVQVEVRRFDLRSERVPSAETVAANLLGPLLSQWASDLADRGDLPGRVIVSGLLAGEADTVAADFAVAGLNETRRRPQGGWLALLLEQRRPMAQV